MSIKKKKQFNLLYIRNINTYDKKDLQIIINYAVIKKLLFQLKIKKLNINKFYVTVLKLKIFDNIVCVRTIITFS